ncbi:LPS export ABC transporter permease LptG [Marinobacter sp. NFXS9]|uniref:LPS export ABC transporter permease LptG n=1 Tax=Marinobacter sp. NFXS9 TaxID=2818433 RepID=UPI0032DF9029
MQKLDRYIIKTVGGATLLVMLVVLSLDLIFAFIHELDNIEKNYQTLQVLAYIFLTLPRRIYDYLPLGAFMGCLIGLGSLASTSELVVIRAAGVSIRRIVWSAMKPTIVVVIIGLILGEFVAPHFEKMAQSEREIARGGESNVASSEGLWHREGNTFIHVNVVQPSGVLLGVSLFHFNDKRDLTSASFARKATYEKDHWMLERVITTELSKQGTIRKTADQMRWDSQLSPSVLSVLIVDPENLSISGLYTYGSYLDKQGLSSTSYWLAFWKKVLGPVAIAVLVLVAISFVFGPLRSVTMGFRVFTGIIVGLIFKYMQDLLGPMSVVFGFSPVIAIAAPIVLSAIVGAVLMRRAG